MNTPRHFLKLSDFSPAELQQVIDRAIALKRLKSALPRPFVGKTLAMIFTKTRRGRG